MSVKANLLEKALKKYIDSSELSLIDESSEKYLTDGTLNEKFFTDLQLVAVNDKNLKSLLTSINEALLQQKVHTTNDFVEDQESLSKQLRYNSAQIEQEEEANKKRAEFASMIAQNPAYSRSIAKFLLQVGSENLSKENLEGFVKLRETKVNVSGKETTSFSRSTTSSSMSTVALVDSEERLFNNILAAEIVMQEMTQPNSTKKSSALAVLATHTGFGFGRTNTQIRMEDVKKYVRTDNSTNKINQVNTEEIIKDLNIEIKRLENAWFYKETAKKKKDVLTELKTAFSGNQTDDQNKKNFNQVVAQWKEKTTQNDPEKLLILDKKRGLFSSKAANLFKKIEIATKITTEDVTLRRTMNQQ